MSKRKYQKGNQIRSVAEFENSKSKFFSVYFGYWKTIHRSFLISWQYIRLYLAIKEGRIFEAVRIEDGKITEII